MLWREQETTRGGGVSIKGVGTFGGEWYHEALEGWAPLIKPM